MRAGRGRGNGSGTAPAKRVFISRDQSGHTGFRIERPNFQVGQKDKSETENTFYRGFCAWREALPPAFLSTAHKKGVESGRQLGAAPPTASNPRIAEARTYGPSVSPGCQAPLSPGHRTDREHAVSRSARSTKTPAEPGSIRRPRSTSEASQRLEGKRRTSQQMAPGQPDRYPKAPASSSPGTKASSARRTWEVY